MEKLRLLHITGDSCFGGASRIILSLGQVAQSQGWDVDVLTTDPTFARAVKHQGLGLVSLDVIRRKIQPMWDVSGLFRLCNFLRHEDYTLVHTHTSKAGLVGRLAARLTRVPITVHTVHGFAFHESSSSLARLFFATLEHLAARWCDRVVSVSDFHRKWALELHICKPDKILSIPNGIAELQSPRTPCAQLRRHLGVGCDDLFLLTPARLSSDKGLNYLIEAASILSGFKRCFKIIIAGDGPARAGLEKQVHERNLGQYVFFLGFREDISDLLAACDIVVLPSLREGLSIALLEAMAAGRPIITTSIGSHKEVALHAEMARLVPPANAAALVEAILQFARDPALMARLGNSARTVFENSYTENRMLNEYVRLYSELLEEKLVGQRPLTHVRQTVIR